MNTLLKNYLNSETGTVTVDWVVLTALVGCLICAAYVGIEGGASDLSRDVQIQLHNIAVGG
jgi:hypothetical protein